jgi:hypothetical protein
MRIDIQVIVDVVAMVGIRVVFKDRRQPDGGAAEVGNVVKVLCNASDFASVKLIIGGLDAGRSRRV